MTAVESRGKNNFHSIGFSDDQVIGSAYDIPDELFEKRSELKKESKNYALQTVTIEGDSYLVAREDSDTSAMSLIMYAGKSRGQ